VVAGNIFMLPKEGHWKGCQKLMVETKLEFSEEAA